MDADGRRAARLLATGWCPSSGLRLALPGVLVLATAVRLHWIGFGSLDVDEGFTVWVARHPAVEIWSVLAQLDDHPPLYYLMLHWWIRIFGVDAVTLRLPSVLSGVLTVALAYDLGRIVGGRVPGVLTAFLVALAPDLVQWSQESRMYALEVLAVTAAIVALGRLLAGDSRPRAAWATYVAATTAAVWTDYTAVLFPVAALTALVWVTLGLPHTDRPAFVRRWLAAHLVVAALCTPLLHLLVTQMTGGTVIRWYVLNPYAPLTVAVVGAALVLVGRALWRGEPHWVALTTALWVVPIACLIAVSVVVPVFAKRAYLWTDVPLALVVAAAVQRVRVPWARAGLIAVVTALAATGVAAHYRDDLAGDVLRGWDRAASYVAAGARPGDLVLFYVPYVQPTFDYYAAQYHLGLEERGVPVDFGAGRMLFPPLVEADAARIPALLAGHPRVWFVHGMYPSPRVILNALGTQGRLLDSLTVTGALTVYLYETHRPAWAGTSMHPRPRPNLFRGRQVVLRARLN